MPGRDGNTARGSVTRLEAEYSDLRSEIAGFLAGHPYRVGLEHDSGTGRYRIWHDGPGVAIPEGIVAAAERLFADLLYAHERDHGEPSSDWEALRRVRGRIAGLVEPILLEGKTRLIFCDGRPTFGNSCPTCGPFRDGQDIAGGAVYPPDTEIEFIPVFEIAFKEDKGLVGSLAGRVVIDLASALRGEIRKGAAGPPSAG